MRPTSLRAAGGFASVAYVLRKAREAGGVVRLVQRLRSRNACKTCALGMGGQRGGMVNEIGGFPEVCKKSVQAQVGDMAPPIGEAFLRATPLAQLERLSPAAFERLGRLAFPILAEAGDSHFRRVSWTEALDRAASAFRAARPDETFFYASGRSSNEAAYLMQLVARALGSANVHNCSSYCHAASSVALADTHGSGTASVVLEDLGRTDLVLLAGANPASNHPRLVTQLVRLRRRGGRVLVVNPLRELGLVRFRIPSDARSLLFGSKVSDLLLQPHVGSDVALLKALTKGVIERGGVDRSFVTDHCTGWEAVEEDARATAWDDLTQACGVGRAQIDAAVSMLLAARRGIIAWAMGVTHHENGVDNVQALANLALARGWLGREGCGLLPIRGHSNVQGVGSMGVAPTLRAAFARQLEAIYGITLPEGAGQDTYASMLAAHAGRIQAALHLGGNLFASNPDRAFAAAALRTIPCTLSLTTKLNEGHVHGRGRSALIAPVLARDEERQTTTQESMFNFVRLSQGGQASPAGEARSEVEILASLAERILPAGGFDWSLLRDHRTLQQHIARAVAGYRAIADIDASRREFQIEGRTFHTPRFATADGRARLRVTPLPRFAPEPGELRLTTLRSEGQFNTVVYEEQDLYRGGAGRDAVLVSAQDASRLGLTAGDAVLVETETGQMQARVTLADIRPGSIAMYYPEANALVPRTIDPRSGTPAFKSVRARLRLHPATGATEEAPR